MTPVGRLTDNQWEWIITAAIFGWIEVRVQQAIDEGRDSEQTVRLLEASPSPCDVAVVKSILPALADTAGVDWSQPLNGWSKETMTGFLMLAWDLLTKAEVTRDHSPGTTLRKSKEEGTANVPFAQRS